MLRMGSTHIPETAQRNPFSIFYGESTTVRRTDDQTGYELLQALWQKSLATFRALSFKALTIIVERRTLNPFPVRCADDFRAFPLERAGAVTPRFTTG